MYILSLNNTNIGNHTTFGMAKLAQKTVVNAENIVVKTSDAKEKIVSKVTIQMDAFYNYVKCRMSKDKKSSVKQDETIQAENIAAETLYKKIKTNKDKKFLISDIFKVKWNNDNVQILKDIDDLMKKTSDKTTQKWYGKPQEIFEKALKENMHYLVLLDDIDYLDKKCEQKLLLDFINKNNWSDDNKQYLTKIAALHTQKGIEGIHENVWDGKTLFEKALADKNIYLLELEKFFGNKYTLKADELLSEIDDPELKAKFIEKSSVVFEGVIPNISNCKTEEELIALKEKYSNQLNSEFWKRNFHGRLLFDRILHQPKLKRSMYETFICELLKALPNYAIFGIFSSIMDMTIINSLYTRVPEEIFVKILGLGEELTDEENELVWEKAIKIARNYSLNRLSKLRELKFLYDEMLDNDEF